MKRLRIGRRLSAGVQPCDIWLGVRIDVAYVYVCPLPLLAFRWARRNACYWENHNECTGCSCFCHQPPHTCVPFGPPERRRRECTACKTEDGAS